MREYDYLKAEDLEAWLCKRISELSEREERLRGIPVDDISDVAFERMLNDNIKRRAYKEVLDWINRYAE